MMDPLELAILRSKLSKRPPPAQPKPPEPEPILSAPPEPEAVPIIMEPAPAPSPIPAYWNPPTHIKILMAVCHKYSITSAQIKGPLRPPHIVRPRMIACYLMYKHCGFSFPHIGKILGKDHSTIMNAVYKIKGRIKIEEDLAIQIKELECILQLDEQSGPTPVVNEIGPTLAEFPKG